MSTHVESPLRHRGTPIGQVFRYVLGLIIVLVARNLAASLPGTYELQPQNYGPAEMVRISTPWWSWPLVAGILLVGLALLGWAASITIRRIRTH